MDYKELNIKGEYIKLDSALKFAGLVPTGGIAKTVIADGLVLLNGEVCFIRGKKLHLGDKIEFDGRGFIIK